MQAGRLWCAGPRAREGLANSEEWNRLNIESLRDASGVYVNGKLAAGRPAAGPIKLQPHDVHSFVMFRNVWILERW